MITKMQRYDRLNAELFAAKQAGDKKRTREAEQEIAKMNRHYEALSNDPMSHYISL